MEVVGIRANDLHFYTHTMALDFHRLEDKKYLFSLSDKQYIGLLEIFQAFKTQTGIAIDPHRDARLTLENIRLLIFLIDDILIDPKINNVRNNLTLISEFKEHLRSCLAKNHEIQIYCD